MIEFAKVADVSLTLVPQLLDGHQLALQLAEKHRALGATSQPLQVRYVLKRNLPIVCTCTREKKNLPVHVR